LELGRRDNEPAHPYFTSEQAETRPVLLSIYDEYTIAYKDISDISEAGDIERMISRGNALAAVIILNGKVQVPGIKL
jgi:hypothetical protein